MLILITGLPGTGKSTVAAALAEAVGALRLNSDIVRDELGKRGQYAPEDKQIVYQTLLDRTRAALEAGRTVVVDATFYKEALREPFRRVAEAAGVPLRGVELEASESVIRQRVAAPRPDSEADFSVYEKIRDAYEPLRQPHLTLRTDDATPEALANRVRQFLENDA